MSKKFIVVTVEFADQLAATNKPVASIEEARSLIDNEVLYENTVQAYAWNSTNGNRIVYCQHGSYQHLLRPGADLNIDTLVEDYRI